MDITGLVIRSVDHGEKDKYLTFATPIGIINAKAKGVRTPSSKLKGFVGVLNFGEFSLAEGRGGYTVTGADITETFPECWIDPDKYAAAMACLEIYEKCTRKGESLEMVPLLTALKNINYESFYPFAETLRYGVICAASSGVDVTEGVFPDDTAGLFLSLLKCNSVEEVLTEYTRQEISLFYKRLSVAFSSELGIKLTIFEM